MLIEEGIREFALLFLGDIHAGNRSHLALKDLTERHWRLEGFIKPDQDVTQPTDVALTTHSYSLVALFPAPSIHL